MATYIKNYGITKTIFKINNKKKENEIKWTGNYNGDIANIQLNINDNGNKEMVKMQLDNNDLAHLLGVQPVETPLDERLINDFLSEQKSLDNMIIMKPMGKRMDTDLNIGMGMGTGMGIKKKYTRKTNKKRKHNKTNKKRKHRKTNKKVRY